MSDFDDQWWQETWRERQEAIWTAFGPSHPHGSEEGFVTSFNFKTMRIPGACAYTFPPNTGDPDAGRERRPHWLYMTHGLTQPLDRASMQKAPSLGSTTSGAGVEFGMIFEQAAPWAIGLLQKIIGFEQEARSTGTRPFESGDRIPFYFERLGPDLAWSIGGEDGPETPPASAIRSLVFWRYLSRFGSFSTQAGSLELRIATMITGAELALAQATSSCHVLLLLDWAGIGQLSIPDRACVTERAGWQETWRELGHLPFQDAKERLRAIYSAWRRRE